MAKDSNIFNSGQSAKREEQSKPGSANGGRANNDRDTGNFFDDSTDRENTAAADSAQAEKTTAPGDGAQAEETTAPGDGAQAEETTAPGDGAQAGDDTAAGDGAQAGDDTAAGNDAKAGDSAEAGDAENAEEQEAVTVAADSAGETEPTPSPTATEVSPTPAPTPEPEPSSLSGGVWIAIIAGLAVLIAAALLLKRFVFDRKAGNGGNDPRAAQSRSGAENGRRGRHIARTEGSVGQVNATMAADGSQVQSQYDVGCAQWIGMREDQEDSLMVSEWRNANAVASRGILAAVADGIGGLDDGQVASQTLMRSFGDVFVQLDPELSPQGKLLELTAQGQREVLDINRRGRRCGTTLVAVLIQGGYLSTISVGDSRIALYRSGVLLQLNREHVNARVRDEETALDGAAPVEGRRRAALTSYIGKEDLRELDRTLNPIRLISGDRVLLMSDGVFGTLSDDQLVSLLEQDAQKAADSIINQVRNQKNQYQDNATVIVIEVM